MRVSNMRTPSGNPAANQFWLQDVPAGITFDGIQHRGGDAFQSYGSLICIRAYDGQVYLDRKKWDCSNTTSRYRNYFLQENTVETRRKIESGEYILADLN